MHNSCSSSNDHNNRIIESTTPEGFSQCADTLASWLSLKLALKSTETCMFPVVILWEFVVLSLFSAYMLLLELQSFAVFFKL